MRRFGQHFLTNTTVLRKLGRIAAEGGGTIIEVGPGHGELTHKLLSAPEVTRVIALERDPILARALEERFAADKRFSLVFGDALETLPRVIAVENGPYAIAGNIPYYITGELLRLIGKLPKLPTRVTLLLQKEVAERLTAEPPHMNRLAAAVQAWATPKIVGYASRHDFRPPPKVDSAAVLLVRHPESLLSAAYERTLGALFAQPRKTIVNNLAGKRGVLSKEAVLEHLQKLGLPPTARPQDLSAQNIAFFTEA